jgi:hypothetical protein
MSLEATMRMNMATAMFAEKLDNFQNSTRLIPESRSCALETDTFRLIISRETRKRKVEEWMSGIVRS